MRVTIKLDSATADELWDMVCAFQRTTGIALPPGLQTEPTITIGGSKFGVTLPPMTASRANAVWREFASLQKDREVNEITSLLH